MKKFIISLFFVLLVSYFCNFRAYSQNAGITSVGSATACPSTIIAIPVNVLHSPLITAISLEIDYDASVLSALQNGNNPMFLSNVNAASGTISDWIYAQTDKQGSPGYPGIKRVTVGWSSVSAIQVDTNVNGLAKLFDIQFRYLGGSTILKFDNSNNNGANSEYADYAYNPLIDTPTVNYYFSGTVSQGNAPSISGNISGNVLPCQGVYETYSVANLSGVTYTWTAPPTWTGTSTTDSITYFVGTFTSGIVSVTPSNLCGTGTVQSIIVNECSSGILNNEDNYKFSVNNYPNPFNNETKINFELPESGFITIDIYNIFGEHLFNVTNDFYTQGKHEVCVNCSKLTEGIYPYRVKYNLKGKIYSKIILMNIIK